VVRKNIVKVAIGKRERSSKMYTQEQAQRIRRYLTAKVVEARRSAEDIKQAKEERSKDVT
jgi:hypothetical protein